MKQQQQQRDGTRNWARQLINRVLQSLKNYLHLRLPAAALPVPVPVTNIAIVNNGVSRLCTGILLVSTAS